MTHFRLRTQLFLATLLTVCGLTGGVLLIIRYTVGVETRRQVQAGTEDSVRAFETVQHQRERQLSNTAAMVADLPPLQAMMTTDDAPTVQDASTRIWRLAGSDLLALARRDRQILALHMSAPGWPAEAAQRNLNRSLEQGDDTSWWYDNGRLYQVFLRRITAGAGNETRDLGWLAIGYQVNSSLAQQLALVAQNQIALAIGGDVIASTLSPNDETTLEAHLKEEKPGGASEAREVALSSDHYAVASVLLHGALPSPVRCYVLMPMGPVNTTTRRLNRTIFILAGSAVVFSALLFGFLANRITRPLDKLVAGVRALAAGDYTFSIEPKGTTEVAELTTAFAKMRSDLLASQRQQIETERVAAIGRAASSLSHDLRHYLAAVVANAEFLYEADELKLDKTEIYREIQTASNQMTDLIDSLRELSHERRAISPVATSLDVILRRAIEAVRVRPEFRHRNITLVAHGDIEGVFDPKKLERVFFNLLLNACEATPDTNARVTVDVQSRRDTFEVRVIDQGPGVPPNIRDHVFDPFVSSGKSNGTGLGLAIVSKIVHDHGGSVMVERTSDSGTVMLVTLPHSPQPVTSPTDSPVV
jgi:signal transduction histidine kinase